MTQRLLLVLISVFVICGKAHAQDEFSGDAYDPFADYSEFEQANEEEADINFFRNGRFFTIGFMGGYRSFTQILGELYKPGVAFGGYISYFFDLRFAMQLSYLMGDHSFGLNTSTSQIRGNISMQEIGFGLKYFMNTQNVTRGLAPINPYILLGINQIYRSIKYDGTVGTARDGTMGFLAAFGVEIPMMRNKMYFGAEAGYEYVNFPDENNQIVVDSTATGVYPRGDVVRFMGLIGLNF